MEKSQKIPPKFYCNFCDYSTSYSKDYNKHIMTRKHQNRTILNEKSSKIPLFVCACGKSYAARNSLWYHKQKCSSIKNELDNKNNIEESDIYGIDNIIDKNFVLSILQQNNDLHKQVIKLLNNGTHHITNNNNKTFNLNVFLNETCKNAMNITDFVNSLQFHLSDFEKLGDVGYINGMSNLIIKNLKDMDITERPVHCTDKKREVLYVKDNNKWDKETQNKPKLRKAIKQVAHKNALLLQEFKEKYPDCMKSESRHSDTYNKLIIEAMGGLDYKEEEQEDKIIKRLAKEVSLLPSDDTNCV